MNIKGVSYSISAGETCVHGDVRMDLGEEHIDAECTSRCTCKPGGRVDCIQLCQPFTSGCQAGQVQQVTKEPVLNSKCSCQVKKCVPNAQGIVTNSYK